MNWQNTLVIGLLLLSAGIGVGLVVFAWRNREFPGAMAFVLLAAASAEWSLTYALELAAPDLASKVLCAKFQYIGIALIPVGWFLFAQGFAGHESWSSRSRTGMLFIIPVITILLVFSNEAHHLIWVRVELNNSGPLRTFYAPSYGLGWWIFFMALNWFSRSYESNE